MIQEIFFYVLRFVSILDLESRTPSPAHLRKVRGQILHHPPKIFRNGELSSDYNGSRKATGIMKILKSQVGPASKKVDTVAQADAMLAKVNW